jgi:hypothetical protein
MERQEEKMLVRCTSTSNETIYLETANVVTVRSLNERETVIETVASGKEGPHRIFVQGKVDDIAVHLGADRRAPRP